MQLPTKVDGSDRVVTVEKDFGENYVGMKKVLTDAGVKDPDEVIFSHARANMKVACRAVVKICMKKEERMSDSEIQAKVDKWFPGIAPERAPETKEKKLASFEKEFDKMTKEEQNAYIASLRSRLAGKKAV